ncbi:MAG: class I SAM-dependent methyltransferase [Aulosira sp. DedQUE10]|nr:class I SAM-dependent methyltransferase [Aulosira sp. DedQUE10]
MFDSIIQQAKQTEYDFRKTANPDDPLAHLFNDWFDYYKLKWAIAHVLKPANILEIGVRYGYSAAAFLHGYSSAKYVGIDLDTDSYGGVKGAINWAKNITQQFSTEYIISDTQAMSCLPGNLYDLIHVDGQQDGDGSFHDLELAIKQSRYVLVDGYLWTRQNFMAVSDFLFTYSNLLDWYGVIPGYAGELLIKVSPNYLNNFIHKLDIQGTSSTDIRDTYTKEYYTQDCGGFDSYKIHQGKRLEDSRLRAVATIASVKKSGRVLDIACGRGELTYHFAKQGFSVTAIDYAQSAIDLAEKCFVEEDDLKKNVEFLCENICNLSFPKEYDLAVASDIIEHLSFAEVELLYSKISQALNIDGLFVIHTFPNLWYYQYEYKRKRRTAASVGAYLPVQPRTRYEMLMHINEQSPRVLKKQLAKHFEHVLVWFGEPSNPGGSLVNKYSKQAVRSATSLFAIAAHKPINKSELKDRLQMYSLPHQLAEKLKLVVTDYPDNIIISNEFEVSIELTNNTGFIINSSFPNPVHISYHWMNEQGTNNIIFDGERTVIFPPLEPISKNSYTAKIKIPQESGNYILRITLVQENVRWFDQEPINLKQDIPITVNLKSPI